MHGGGVYDASYIQFYQLLIDVKVSGRKYTELTATELQTVENIAQANTYGSVYAESLLAMLNQTTINRVPHKESAQGNKKALENTKQGFSVYPNPTKDVWTIQIPFKEAEAVVYDLTGKVVQQLSLVKGKNEVENSLEAGSYIVQFKVANQLRTQKIIILP